MALIISAIIVFFQHAVQKIEESALNAAGRYCLKNLINRMYTPEAAHGTVSKMKRPRREGGGGKSR